MNEQEVFVRTGGLFSAKNLGLGIYISFAYKLSFYEFRYSLESQLPKWANTDKWDIEARVLGNPTKDQFRLMMQSLLLQIASSSRPTGRLVNFQYSRLVLDKPGKLGAAASGTFT